VKVSLLKLPNMAILFSMPDQKNNHIAIPKLISEIKYMNFTLFFKLILMTIVGLLFLSCSGEKRYSRAASEWTNFVNDGAWCWFSDPRAIYYSGQKEQTYVAWVDSEGSIKIGAYNHRNKEVQTATLHEKLEKDDHDVPSIMIRKDGIILTFYSRHSKDDFYLRVSKNPEDISQWQPAQLLKLNETDEYPAEFRRTYCYSNPFQLSQENGKIFLFWRGINNKPNFSISENGGESWSRGTILISPKDTYRDQRPYVKYFSNYRDKIHFAFTDGHPRNEPTNGIYYMYYQNGNFFKANGQKICQSDSLPVDTRETDIVYDARITGTRAWVWDVATDEMERPVIVYTRLPNEAEHEYFYAVWDGKKWINNKIVSAGKWFPQTQPGTTEREPHYSGGIIIDRSDPSVVYLSRPINGIFEIEHWQTMDMGKTWRSTAVTQKSTTDNIRPFVPWNTPKNLKPHLFWLTNYRYIHYTDYLSAIKMDVPEH
jgi:hypothetical protein